MVKDVLLSCDMQTKRIIILEYHNDDHERVRLTFERIKLDYVEITANDVCSIIMEYKIGCAIYPKLQIE